jgi:hypothetical protein
MHGFLRLFVGVLLAALPMLAQATPDPNSDREIRHLVEFVSASGCTFIRNGDAHDSKSAAEHLLMKYQRAQSRLKTAEQFIDAVATRSYLSGREYRVQCPGQPETANAPWLQGELAAWRDANQAD